jgi:hypothetical protein
MSAPAKKKQRSLCQWFGGSSGSNPEEPSVEIDLSCDGVENDGPLDDVWAGKATRLQSKFPWMVPIKQSGDRIFVNCSVCTKHKLHIVGGSTWCDPKVGGVAKDAYDLSQHAKTQAHAEAMRLEELPPVDTAMKNAMDHATRIARTFTELVLQATLMMVICHVPLSNFPWQVSMLAKGGAALVLATRNNSYTHFRYVWRCVFALSEMLLRMQVRSARASPYFSLACDTSMDLVAQDHLVIVIRYLDAGTLEACTQYLCTVNMSSKDASAIFEVLMAAITALGLDVAKLVSFAADGDSTMMGKWNGVAAKLREKVPHLIVTHCVAHRTALMMNDCSKRVKGMATVDKTLKVVHNLFSKSSKKTSAWEAWAAPRQITRFRFPVFNATRWFSRMQCIIVLCSNMLVLLSFLRDCYADPNNRVEEWEAGEAAYKMVCNVQVAAMLFLQDILAPIERLSKSFQADGILPHHVEAHLKTTRSVLYSLQKDKNLSSPLIRGFLDKLSKSNVYQPKDGEAVKLRGKLQKEALKLFKQQFIESVLKSLASRFSDTDLLAAFKMFDPACYVDFAAGSLEADKVFLAEALRLLERFHLLVGVQDFTASSSKKERELYVLEFKIMRDVIFSKCMEPRCSMLSMWRSILVDAKLRFPKMLALFHIMLVVLVHSADAERIFSTTRVTKHRLTNRLQLQTLDSLIRIKKLGPRSLEEYNAYDVEHAIPLHVAKDCSLLNTMFAAVHNALVPDADLIDDAKKYPVDVALPDEDASSCDADSDDEDGLVDLTQNQLEVDILDDFEDSEQGDDEDRSEVDEEVDAVEKEIALIASRRLAGGTGM